MKYLPFIFFFFVALTSCSSDDEPKPVKNEELPEPSKDDGPPLNTTAITMGTFTSFAHSLSGKAVIYFESNNKRTLRLENFTMTAGPDVYVFLSKTNNYSDANTIPVGVLKEGYDNSDLTLNVDDMIDLTTHKFVLVYCVEFSSLFGYAEPQ